MVQPCRRCGQMHDDYTGCTLAARRGRPTVVGEDEALVGNVVADRYQVGDVLGVGATGTVFGVHHVTFSRPAAMKVLRPRYASADLVSRVFHGEARAAWSVSHPCLTEVFDIGTLPGGAPFFVMERLDGETLTARIARERLSLAAAVDVMMQLLSAIAAIHARDLLLRDLRPQNIFLAHRRGCRPTSAWRG
jgi:serine/threonine-protein kinase